MSARGERSGERAGGEPAGRKNFLGTGNDAFTCLVCGCEVLPLANGSFRSHCPECLWSQHVDEVPGDRAAQCGGLMEPIGLEGSAGSGWRLVHACVQCGAVRRNRTAEDDPRQPDNWERLVEVSRAPRRRET
ncbi:MAG: RNHCP domain-containing protein [Planctomycetes bacterium]|nr:RNHCP domain-containing protein [Planctomycetota bacterium]